MTSRFVTYGAGKGLKYSMEVKGRQSKVYDSNRVCSSCGNGLSIYNPEKMCSGCKSGETKDD